MLPNTYPVREVDLIQVVGKDDPLKIYDYLSEKIYNGVQQFISLYYSGLAAYRTRNWVGAEQSFTKALKIIPEDNPSKLFLQRIKAFRKVEPKTDWSSVWKLTEK